jgi:hypothetical protein
MECVFIRDTEPHEDSVIHRKGETANLGEASVQRWLRRGAIRVTEPGYETPAGESAPGVDYSAKSAAQLVELAERRGIELPARPSKKAVIALLEAYDRGDVEAVDEDDDEDDGEGGEE